MNRIVPLLPPLALLILVAAVATRPYYGPPDTTTIVRGLPLVALAALYVWCGRKGPARE